MTSLPHPTRSGATEPDKPRRKERRLLNPPFGTLPAPHPRVRPNDRLHHRYELHDEPIKVFDSPWGPEDGPAAESSNRMVVGSAAALAVQGSSCTPLGIKTKGEQATSVASRPLARPIRSRAETALTAEGPTGGRLTPPSCQSRCLTYGALLRGDTPSGRSERARDKQPDSDRVRVERVGSAGMQRAKHS
jgi:hypothetical protein